MALGLLLPLCAVAGGSISGTVGTLIVRQSDGLTYVYINGTATGQPACAVNTYWIIANETSDAGHKLYALLLSAKIAGMTVSVMGDGTCTRWSDGENILSVFLVG
jgi:hypothetical protein